MFFNQQCRFQNQYFMILCRTLPVHFIDNILLYRRMYDVV